MKRISVAPYLLQERKGALLKIAFEEGLEGFADCHPWEALGDAPLAAQLELLSKGKTTSLTERSVCWALIDAEARRSGRHVLSGKTIPDSHFLLFNLERDAEERIELAARRGFGCVKIKIGRSLSDELSLLRSCLPKLPSSLKVRLDANERLQPQEFEKVLHALSPWQEKIDFYEDPTPFDSVSWAKWQSEGVRLACDRASHLGAGDIDAASVIVFKPAIEAEPRSLHPRQELVITSYLDHPVGQTMAALAASICRENIGDRVKICGLVSHLACPETEFSSEIGKGPAFCPSSGSGCGFDRLLADQPWVQLSF